MSRSWVVLEHQGMQSSNRGIRARWEQVRRLRQE